MEIFGLFVVIAIIFGFKELKELRRDFEEKSKNLQISINYLKEKIREQERQLREAKSEDNAIPVSSVEPPPLPAQLASAKIISEEKQDKATETPEVPEIPQELTSKPILAEKDEKASEKKSEVLPEDKEYAWLKNIKKEAEEDIEAADFDKQVADSISEAEESFIAEDEVEHDEALTPPNVPPIPPDEPVWQDRFHEYFENIDWEQFAGTKLFAWIGGIALFFAAGFFVNYAIDKELISPIMRLVIGAIIGLGMIGASFKFERGRYNTMREVFSAGGIGVLYSVFFAATLYYDYLPKTMGFISLSVVSAAAFVLAIFHRGISISVLGAIGAYLTPLLVTTGQGNLITLYAYLAIVNYGLYQVIKRLKSTGLVLFSALGTMFSLAAASLFAKPSPEAFHLGIAWSANLLFFSVLIDQSEFKPSSSRAISWTAIFTYISAPLVAALISLTYVGSMPMLMLAFAATLATILSLREADFKDGAIPYFAITFIAAIVWVFLRFNGDLSPFTFIFFFIYGLSTSAGPIFLVRKYGCADSYIGWFRIFPIALAILGLIAVIVNPQVSYLFWPVTMGLQLLGFCLSLIFGGAAQLAILALLFFASGMVWINFATPIAFTAGFYAFMLLTGIALCFGLFLILTRVAQVSDRLSLTTKAKGEAISSPEFMEWMSAAPVAGIFFLIGASFLKAGSLSLNPGMATIACFLVVVLALARRLNLERPAVVSFFAAAMAQAIGVFSPKLLHAQQLNVSIWSGALFILSLVLPFIFFSDLKKWKKLWMAWGIFEAAQAIFLIYGLGHLYSRDIVGWVPLILAFMKVPAVAILLRRLEGTSERNSIIACQGGALLLYVSSTPMILLEKGWLGLAVVIEATALLWLNCRIPHPGLRYVSSVMAPVGMYILISNVPEMSAKAGRKILNSAVMSITGAVVALFAAVKLAAHPQEELGKINLRKYFQWLAVFSGFYLLNLVVADIFSGDKTISGATFDFIFKRNLPREIAYTTIWALFGAILWWQKSIPRLLRYFGLLLLVISTGWLVMFPILHGSAVAGMRPVFNLGLLAYFPIMLILLILFLKEDWGETWVSTKNLFLGMLLIAGFLCMKMVKATIFQAGMPLDLFRERTAEMAVASIAGWLIYGLAMLKWPKRLDKPFRLAGLSLVIAAFFRALSFPIKYAVDFGAMKPLLNRPTFLYLGIVALLIWLTRRKEDETWPISSFCNQKTFWAFLLSIMSFLILNIEIASVFGREGAPFSYMTHGNLAHQLGYSLGWLVYAIIMLISGIRWQAVKARQAALLLIIVTSLKIFLKDLWSLGQLYRVASFIGLAVVMMLVSYLYQRFLAKPDNPKKQ